MPLSQFHPVIQRWFAAHFENPSPPQAAGWPRIAAGEDTLICAPTGSGKTLTAFLACIDTLFRKSVAGELLDRTEVVYVSPLKALSNDIEKNLREPLAQICETAFGMGLMAPDIRVALRTGDTSANERAKMAKLAPHILVTTPESLFILLTSEKARLRLRHVKTVIVDEIHSVARDKRGAHLALTLERLDALCEKPPQRVGLSATQRPVERVAEFLVGGGSARRNADGSPRCAIVNLGHLRKIELSLELPSTPLESVCSGEMWEEAYNRLTELILANKTTLIFVNTRRMCERLAARLTQRLGENEVTSHHGSLSREQRLSAETRLRKGELRALVATSSLELGIDIGHVDLVCQIGITNAIGTLMQRVGRSGHSLHGVSKGKIFALTLEELMTACALCSSVKRGHMDVLTIPDKPLDVLAQQIVATAATEEWDEDALYQLVIRAHNYRTLDRKEFDEVVAMLSEGFSTRRGRTTALIHYDGVGRRIRGKRGARLAAITSGGAIPDTASYQVVQDPEALVVGSVDEHFAVDSSPGDIFQLGNTSWQITKVETGRVRVQDARGQPPTIPFWFGEAPPRSDALSEEVTRLRAGVEERTGSGFRVPGSGNGEQIESTDWMESNLLKGGVINAGENVSGSRGVESGDRSGGLHSSPDEGISKGRDVRVDKPDSKVSGVDIREHRRRVRSDSSRRLSPSSFDRSGLIDGNGDASRSRGSVGLPETREGGRSLEAISASRPNAEPSDSITRQNRSRVPIVQSQAVIAVPEPGTRNPEPEPHTPEAWLTDQCAIPEAAASQLAHQLTDTHNVLGAIPTKDCLVLERFFDESGGMQLILHAPFGRRINWAWGLALRKRFCRGFNFELQAAATENALLLSLGPQHSFPLADVFHFLHANTVESLLIQAALEAPVFQTRWRWDACRSLALLRFSGGKKVPPHLMRMRSDDLMAAVFPHAAACPENLPGDREVPDHPLVREVMRDCLHEAMDIDGLKAVLTRIAEGKIRLVAKDTVEPSLLANDILTAMPYSFLDDADLQERRARAVYSRRASSRMDDGGSISALDPAAIERVRDEVRPEPRDADELHDVLMTAGFLLPSEMRPFAAHWGELVKAGRAVRIGFRVPGSGVRERQGSELFAATERVPLFEILYPGAAIDPVAIVPAKERAKNWTAETALVEILRGRMEISGPLTVTDISCAMELPESTVEAAMIALEAQGVVMRGHFSPDAVGSRPAVPGTRTPEPGTRPSPSSEWCDRRLLARIHRYTMDRLRREIEPSSAQEFLRFLFAWQHVDADAMLEGPRGVGEAVAQLQGFEIAAVAWEREILPARVKNYDRRSLDQLCLSGQMSWGRLIPAQPNAEGAKHSGMIRHSPIGLYLREQLEHWLELAPPHPENTEHLSGPARQVLEQLAKRGAVFFQNLVRDTKCLPMQIEQAIGELVAYGYVTGDGFGGLRALLKSAGERRKIQKQRRQHRARQSRMSAGATPFLGASIGAFESTGRWSLFRGDGAPDLFGAAKPEDVVDMAARQLLRRYGVVFHKLVEREPALPPWIELLRVFRRMEARGELRGGRFVAGFSGEQYALPEAVEHLRNIRRTPAPGKLVMVCGCDPLNLVGIITPGEKVAARIASRIVFLDGVPVAIKEAKSLKILARDATPALAQRIHEALMKRAM